MKLKNPFPIPDIDPEVPEHLAERVTNLLPYTTKIDVVLRSTGHCKVVNTLYLDGEEEACDVYSMIKMSADQYCEETGDGGKFRAQMWRYIEGNEERRSITFAVRLGEEGGGGSFHAEREALVNGWKMLTDAIHRHAEFSEESNRMAQDRLLEHSRRETERLSIMPDVIHELVTPYRDGLQMKAEAIREVGDLRVQHKLTEAKLNDSGKFWEIMGPAVKVAAAQAQQRLMGTPKALPPGRPAATPTSIRSRVVAAANEDPAPEPSNGTPKPSPPPEPPAQREPHQTSSEPVTLHELATGLLDGLRGGQLVRLTRRLNEEQSTYLEAVSQAKDDDTAAEVLVALMASLMETPATLVELQAVLDPDQVQALQQLAILAKRHIDSRAAAASPDAAPADGTASINTEEASPTSEG